jgi:DNA-binding MarR family transcriptional regulator
MKSVSFPVSALPPAAADVELAGRLRLVVTRLRRRLRRQSGGDLTPSQASALASVERLGPMTLGELSSVEGVQPPTMTRIVGALEAAGLLTRHADPSDRRVARVAITETGADLLAQRRMRADADLASRLAALSGDDRAALVRAVEVLERLLEAEG